MTLKTLLTKVTEWAREAIAPSRRTVTVHIGDIPPHHFSSVDLPSISDSTWSPRDLNVTARWTDALVGTDPLRWVMNEKERGPKECHVRVYNRKGMVIGIFYFGDVKPTGVQFLALSDGITANIALKCSKCVVHFFPFPIHPGACFEIIDMYH